MSTVLNYMRKIYGIIKDIKSFNNLVVLKLNYNRKHSGNAVKINVVFLYQTPELWNKLQAVYEEAVSQEQFNVIVLAIPVHKLNSESGMKEFLDNEALKASKDFNCTVIDARVNGTGWQDLKSLKPDYVFYQRPYENYLPEIYRSYNTIKYTKSCYVPYGWNMTTNLDKTSFNKEFFRNLYLFYAEKMESLEINKKSFPLSHALNLRKTLCLGFPSIDLVGKLKNSQNISFTRDKKLDKLRIIWTPRWTVDTNLCASNFFQYKDKFVEFAKDNEDIYILFRPHPLAFENYLKVGLMSRDEIHEYKNNVNALKNASIDTQSEYLTSFWNSDILVSDFSSIIIEYFFTGKPIIYCDNGTAPLDKATTEMSKGFYFAKNFKEIESIISELEKGNDRLKNTRQKLIKELYGDNPMESSKRIIASMVQDFIGQ